MPISEEARQLEEAYEWISENRGRPQDGDDTQVLTCEACGEDTVLVPHPDYEDGTTQCANCKTTFYFGYCARCSEAMLSETGFPDEILLHDNCLSHITRD